MNNDYYELLQVHPHADQEAIQAAYERLILRYDPKHLEGMGEELLETARQRRLALETAYATLSDPQRRAAYDQRQASGVMPQETSTAGEDGEASLNPSPPSPGPLPPEAISSQPVLDYRPLPPALRQERARHFDARPQQIAPDAPGTTPRMALLIAGLLVLAILALSLGLSGGFTQVLPKTAQATALPTAVASEYDRYEASISEARQATQQNPNDVLAWVSYGNALYDSVQIVRENAPMSSLYRDRLPRWLEASQAYERALQLQGDQPNPLVLSDRGASLCYYGAGIADQTFVTQGLSDTHTAVNAAPNESLILFNYANCLISTNPPRVAEAAQQWQRILEVTPADSPIAARARELLSQNQP